MKYFICAYRLVGHIVSFHMVRKFEANSRENSVAVRKCFRGEAEGFNTHYPCIIVSNYLWWWVWRATAFRVALPIVLTAKCPSAFLPRNVILKKLLIFINKLKLHHVRHAMKAKLSKWMHSISSRKAIFCRLFH